MAGPQERCITDPAQLHESDLAASPDNAGETTQQATPRLRLVLLQPLADPAMFAVCRDPTVIGHETLYLDISALDKAWRHALANVPPTPHITFDLSLPNPVDDSQAPLKIYWDTATPPTKQHMAIVTRNVMRLVASLATVTRMRVQGEVHFGLVYDEVEGVSTRAMDLLSGQLKGIAKAKGTLQPATVQPIEGEANNQLERC